MTARAIKHSDVLTKEIFDRIEGKVKDVTEVTGAEGGPVVHTIHFGDGNSNS